MKEGLIWFLEGRGRRGGDRLLRRGDGGVGDGLDRVRHGRGNGLPQNRIGLRQLDGGYEGLDGRNTFRGTVDGEGRVRSEWNEDSERGKELKCLGGQSAHFRSNFEKGSLYG